MLLILFPSLVHIVLVMAASILYVQYPAVHCWSWSLKINTKYFKIPLADGHYIQSFWVHYDSSLSWILRVNPKSPLKTILLGMKIHYSPETKKYCFHYCTVLGNTVPYTSTKIKRSSPGQYRVAKITCLYICICNNHVKMCAKNNKDPWRVHYYVLENDCCNDQVKNSGWINIIVGWFTHISKLICLNSVQLMSVSKAL